MMCMSIIKLQQPIWSLWTCTPTICHIRVAGRIVIVSFLVAGLTQKSYGFIFWFEVFRFYHVDVTQVKTVIFYTLLKNKSVCCVYKIEHFKEQRSQKSLLMSIFFLDKLTDINFTSFIFERAKDILMLVSLLV